MNQTQTFEKRLLSFLESHLNERDLTLEAVGGGFIARAFKVSSSDGGEYFVKGLEGSDGSSPRTFEREAYALELIAPYFRTPKVYATSEEFLVLEWIETGSKSQKGYKEFGSRLAAMHRGAMALNDLVGFPFDNTIGATLQINENFDGLTWPDFFWEKRLLPQIEWASEKGYSFDSIKKLEKRTFEVLSEVKESCTSLLHGDLWGGNHKFDNEGKPWLFDPASYYGHREADLAMMHLFGSFPSEVFESYIKEWPLENGYEKRLPIYQLYHVLNHVNLFGGSYYSQAKELIRSIL